MADENGIDVLMQVVVTSKSLAMEAESQTDFQPLPPRRFDGRRTSRPANSASYAEFDFAAGVEKPDQDQKKKDEERAGRTPSRHQRQSRISSVPTESAPNTVVTSGVKRANSSTCSR